MSCLHQNAVFHCSREVQCSIKCLHNIAPLWMTLHVIALLCSDMNEVSLCALHKFQTKGALL